MAFYGSIVFGIVGIVFASIQACECCKGACGGYRGRNKMFAIYGAVATIWQVVPFVMYLSFYLATKRVVDVLLKFGIGAEVFDAILGVLLVCVLLAVSLVVTRGINTFLSWAAAKSPHSRLGYAPGYAPRFGLQAAAPRKNYRANFAQPCQIITSSDCVCVDLCANLQN